MRASHGFGTSYRMNTRLTLGILALLVLSMVTGGIFADEKTTGAAPGKSDAPQPQPMTAPVNLNGARDAALEQKPEEALARVAFARMQAGESITPAEKELIESYRSVLPEFWVEDDGRGGNSLDNVGGPDPYNYWWVDNTGTDTVVYNWIELCTDPLASCITVGGDDISNSIPLGLTFPYYGNNYTSAWASSNGMLSLSASNSGYFNTCISSSNTNYALYVYWDDMLQTACTPGVCANGRLYYRNFGSYTVIEWKNFDPFSGSGLTSVEVILWNTGLIKYQWNTPDYTHSSVSATIAIEAPGTNGLQYMCNTAGIVGGRAVVFYRYVPPTPELGVSLLSPCGIVAPNPAQPVSFRVTNSGGGASAACTGYFSFDGGATTGNYAVPPIAPSSFFDVFFAVPVNLTPGPHTLSGWFLPHDTPSANDSAYCTITAQRPCASCTPADAVLDPVPSTPWAGTIASNCGNAGKWSGAFTTVAGRIYHFDLCSDVPGSGTANFDIDIKIVNASCTIITGQDGSCSGSTYRPNDFAWTAPATGTYYVILAPYSSYNSHSCGGTASNTFTMQYYEEIPPPPPPNDLCADAIPLTLGGAQYCGTTVGATDNCAALPYNEVWHTFTLTECRDVAVEYCGTSPNGFLMLTLYNAGCCLGSAIPTTSTEYATCIDGNVTTHYASLSAGTYWLPVGFSTQGPYCVRVTGTPCTPGTECSVPYVISALPYSDAQTTVGRGNNHNPSCPAATNSAPDVAYHYTPAADEWVTASLCGSSFDTKLGIYDAGNVVPGAELFCNDDFCALQSEIRCVPLSAGVTYCIVVDGYGSGSGNYTLNITNCATPTTVYVDDSWQNQSHVNAFNPALIWQYDAYNYIPDGIDAVGGSTVYVLPGTYPTGLVHITGPVTVVAYDMLSPRPLITATASGAVWFDIDPGVAANFNYLAFDGTGQVLSTCIQHQGTGSITECTFSHIADIPGSYQGYAIDAFGGPLTVENCQFSDIYRVGIYFTNYMTGTIRGNTYMGKGVGDWLDYAFVIGEGSTALIENNTVSGCLGVASTDGSTSAGIYCWSDPGVATMNLHGNVVYGNSLGVAVDDAWSLTMWSNATITNNNLATNVDQALWSVSHNLVEATANWWGDVNGPDLMGLLSGAQHPQRRSGQNQPRNRALDDPNDIIGILHYSPWVATSGSDHDPLAQGWQPDLSVVGVSPNGTIQEGVNLVSGSTVMITPGTYTNPVLITGLYPSGLFLVGPNAGIDPCTGSRVAEAVINTPGVEAIDVQSSNVTIDGLKITNPLNGVAVNAMSSSITVQYCIVDGATDTGINYWRASSGTVEHNQILNCAIAGISGGDDAGTPGIGDDIQMNAVIEHNCLNNDRLAITGYHNGSLIRYNTISNYSGNPVSAGISGQQLNTTVRGNAVTGYAISAGMSLTTYPNRPNSSGVIVDSNLFTGNAAGLYMSDPVSGLQVVSNVFSNSTYNAYDANASYYDGNCWSDYATNPGFPAQYDVPGGGNADFNPNANDCGGVELFVSSSYVGCETACVGDTLYLTFDGTGYITGQLFIQLAAGLDANWAAGNQYQNVMPAANASTNLVFAGARRSTGNQIEVNVQWAPPYSTGNASQYIAGIPVRNATGIHCQTLTFAGASSNFYDASGPHINSFSLGAVDVRVDCEDPTANLFYTTAPACNAFGTAAQLEGLMTTSVLRGGVPCNSQLESAYVEVNGIVAQQVPLFSGLLIGDFNNASFPSAAEAVSIFGWLNEGCNQLVLHAFDAECNEGLDTLVVMKDTGAPTLAVVQNPPDVCFSDHPLSPSYGGTALDDKLDIITALGTGCVATTGTLTISYLANNYSVPLDVTNYPISDGEALALWNVIKTWVPGANGGSYTFNVEARDCAGNASTGTFTICIDLTLPPNTLTEFDARPTDEGVWLKWSWNTNPTQAERMEVWRSNYISGDFPGYPFPNPARWQVLSSNTNYPQSYPPAGYSLVAGQDGITGTTAQVYTGLNGKGNNIHNGPGLIYWKDEDASWVDESEDRGIYRYVTFVKDNAGNWSQLSGYTLNINADRSTNYWLGDYSREVTVSPDPSDGDVFTADLSLLSSVYFTSVPPSPGFFDIGPENAENGIGKGVPTPDGAVNFQDLIPFSFNFGMTGPGTFRTEHPNTAPFTQLDEQPSVTIARADEHLLVVGEIFSVVVSLSGNVGNVVKVAEAELEYNPYVLEFVEATPGQPVVVDGIPFVAAKPIAGRNNAVGIAGAALGEIAVLSGDTPLAVIQFRWKADRVGTTNLQLSVFNLADGFGNVVTGSGSAMSLDAHGAIPTQFALYQNYPNPFNPTTNIRFDLADGADVYLVIYNIMGQEVRTLVSQFMPAGAYNLAWDGLDNSGRMAGSGMYFYRISAGPLKDIKKMLLTR